MPRPTRPEGARPTLRPLADDDDMVALTALIHRAYAALAAAGMHFWATHQSVEDTIERCGRGEAWVAELDGAVVGTITLNPPAAARGCAFYDRPDVASFHQLAVEPALQGRGLGRALLGRVEERAAELGATWLALDTSERAHELIQRYQRWGYVRVGDADWRPKVNYRSVVLGKQVGPTGGV